MWPGCAYTNPDRPKISSLHATLSAGCRGAAMKHVGQLAGLFSSMLLDGAATPELVQQGYTTEEERSASGLSQVHPVPLREMSCASLSLQFAVCCLIEAGG